MLFETLVKLRKGNIGELKYVHGYSAADEEGDEDDKGDSDGHCADGGGGNNGFQHDRL